VDTIDTQARIPATGLEKTMITQRTDDKESQGERPGFQGRKKADAAPPAGPEDEKPGEKNLIDIVV
jgi:hypothetical protein